MALGIVCRGMNSRKLWYGFRLTLQSVQVTCNICLDNVCLCFRRHGDSRVRMISDILQSYIYIRRLQFQVEVRTANICQNPERK